MNFSFRGTFGGAKFSHNSYKFSKSFFSFNSKSHMNFFNNNNNQGSKLKVNFSNVYFMNKLQNLGLSQTIASQMTIKRIVSGLVGASESDMNKNISSTSVLPSEAVVLIGDICLIREDCKWTCSTRLASGPQSTVLAPRI